ncbi:ABC transporter permease [Streptococcus acidominimus]|uniref:ABC transporter permease n=1 Tax=Streptococcus acidominimus TaxID=1326 RepID=A0A380IH73_STRAI|nr:FtsX-like permease family protein [Streptococcus acidominimus]SUN08419.1 ABC transporter permease [Streptococcus acidominimus]
MVNLTHPNAYNLTYTLDRKGVPTEGSIVDKEAKVKELASQTLELNAIPVTGIVTYRYIEQLAGKLEENKVQFFDRLTVGFDMADISILYIFDAASYQEMTGEHLELASNQVAVYAKGIDLDSRKPLMIGDQAFTIQKVLSRNFTDYKAPSNITHVVPGLILVVQDLDEIREDVDRKVYVGVETSLSEQEQAQRWEDWREVDFNEMSKSLMIHGMGRGSRAATHASTFAFSGSLFFIGVFLSIVFLVATILVIYYKQISEAYEDRERFGIMQKLGLDEQQTKQSVRKQMLTVFFLPLVFAFTHLLFAYKMLQNILLVIGVLNSNLVMQVTLVSCLGYLVLYVVVYLLTSRSYRNIISSH